MIKQFFTLAIRSLLKDKIFSLINLTNLVVGFATFILLTLFIIGQFNWDTQNTKYDQIYKLQLFRDQEENAQKHSWNIPPALSRNDLLKIPEIEKVALLHDAGDNNKSGIFLSVDKRNQVLTRFGYFSDPSIFDILTFKFLEGDPKTALLQPYSIALSKSVADKLFPKGKAIGKQVYGENKIVFTVTGVYTDIPLQSSWVPSYLLSMNTFAPITQFKDFEQNYYDNSFYTYVLLKENADPASVDKKIHGALKNYQKSHYPYLRPMSHLHLNPFYDNSIYIVLALFSFIALLILVLSSINFINLQTANASTRIREIGIKKTVGFTKRNLLTQFVLESVFITMVAGIIALVVAQLFLPVFNNIVGVELLSNILTNWKIIGIVLPVSFLTGLLSGLYPAFVISAYNPIKALKQRYLQNDSNGISLKNILVTVQFSISLFLLIVSFIIFKQTDFMMHSDLGFNSKNLAYANITTNKKGSFDLIRQRLMQHPEITDACYSDFIPYVLPGGRDINWEGAPAGERVFVRYSNVSYDFFSTFGIKIKEGRPFSRAFPADANKCLINETAVKVFNWKNPIGHHMRIDENDYEVIGIIKDYIFQSFHNPQEPHFYRLLNNDTVSLNGIFTVRFTQGTEKKAMQIIKSEFEQTFPDDAFEFSDFQLLVLNENALLYWQMFRNISIFFAILSIIISSIGLFGLVMFFTKRKMKEIGIRKVFGFSMGSLYITMSKGFMKLLLISIIIAWPLAFYIYKTLPGAHKYPISINEFVVATLIILVVAIITISYQIIKASKMNPVDVLKDE
jgi:putative ABC transport system permease protein